MTIETIQTNVAQSQLAGTGYEQYLPYTAIAFFMMIVLLAVNSHRKWSKIADPFRTDMKLRRAYKDVDLDVIRMGDWQFRRLIVAPLDQGLYIARWGFLNMLFTRRVLIPWTSFSNIYTKKRSVLGISVEEYFVDVMGTERVQLQITMNVAKEILQKNFLKQD